MGAMLAPLLRYTVNTTLVRDVDRIPNAIGRLFPNFIGNPFPFRVVMDRPTYQPHRHGFGVGHLCGEHHNPRHRLFLPPLWDGVQRNTGSSRAALERLTDGG